MADLLASDQKRCPGILGELEQPRPKPLGRRPGWFIFLITLILYLAFWRLYVSDNEPFFPSDSSVSLVGNGFDWYKLKPAENITWTDCLQKYKCARLSLPLDYTTPEGPKTEIALMLLPANDTANYKGTIFLNPGGPGGSGTSFIHDYGDQLSKVVGPEFDLLGFDPRGTGATTPLAQCFDSDQQYKLWGLQSLYTLIEPTVKSLGMARSREAVVGEVCQRSLGGNGKEELGGTAAEWGPGRFMNTPYVTTDMVKIMEELGQEKMLYWGFSYGTVLGQYFSTMYPDKVGRVIIDGVYDGEDYKNGRWATNMEDTDAVYHSFYRFCYQAGPSKCPLYEPGFAEIKNRVDNIFVSLLDNPIPVPFARSGPAIITKGVMHYRFFRALYEPVKSFAGLANELHAIETRNETALEAIVNGTLSYKCECSPGTLPWEAENEAFYAIACGDAGPRSEKPGEMEAHYRNLTAKSHFGAPIWVIHRLQCLEWKIQSKWRFTDPLVANTSNPILIINPTYDPVCPLSDALKVKERYVGAGLLEQNSHGHCSLAAPSVCTAKAVRAYFVNGTLPEEGTVCEPDELPFVGKRESKAMSAEDEELLDALRGLTGAVPFFGL